MPNSLMKCAAFVFACCLSTLGSAQENVTTAPNIAKASTPAQCIADADTWRMNEYRKQVDSSRKSGEAQPSLTSFEAPRAAALRDCAQKFSIAATSGADLIPLVVLYAQANMPKEALAATSKRLDEPGVSDVDRANILVGAIRMYSSADSARLKLADPYIVRLDALPDALTKTKLAVHAQLNEMFREIDVDHGMRVHSEAIVAIGRRIYKTSGDSAAAVARRDGLSTSMLMSAYENIADVQGDDGHADSALTTLRGAIAAHPEFTEKETAGVRRSIERFQLVGTKAPAIEAGHWLNAPPETRSMSPAGMVSVIGFTAHWCPPCNASYPYLVALQQQLGPKGARFMLNTEFYGFVADRKNLNLEQEVDASRDYYVVQHGINFPIAIAGTTPDPNAAYAAAPHPNFDHYKTEWIPMLFITDKHGVVRRILTGWDLGNPARITQQVTALLKEK